MNLSKRNKYLIAIILVGIIAIGAVVGFIIKKDRMRQNSINHIHKMEANLIEWIYSFGTNTNIRAIEAYELNGTLFYHVDFSDEEVIGIDSEPEFCEFDGALIYYGESSRQLINFNWSESSKEYERKFFDWYDEAVREGVYYKYNDDELNLLINEYKG